MSEPALLVRQKWRIFKAHLVIEDWLSTGDSTGASADDSTNNE